MTIFINKFVLGDEEKKKIQECIDGDWFAGNSKFNVEFENRVKLLSGMKYYQTTNSGSAALEIAVQVLVQSGRLKEGDKFVHPAITFPTSLSAAIMAGLVPVYVDSDEGTYQISCNELEKAIEQYPDIKLAIIPALLGNIPDMDRIKQILGDRYLIVDSCDLMGGKYGDREFVSYGDMGAYSHYGSHHISTLGVGGGFATNNDEFYKLAHSMTFWGRDFDTDKLDKLGNFLKRYSYYTLGLDAQMTAIQAAVGVAQIEKLPELVGERNRIFRKLQTLFSKYQSYFILPQRTSDKADPSWFCYPLVCRNKNGITREHFAEYLLRNDVEVRPIMAGNILNHLPFGSRNHHVVGDLKVANEVYNRGLFIPCYPMDFETEVVYFEILEEYLTDL